MLMSFLMWLGPLFGLFAAILPGGSGPASAALWGAAGAIGLGILVLLAAAHRSGTPRR
jgi:hypothetical protein